MGKKDKIPVVPNRTKVGVNYPWFQNKEGIWFGPLKDDVPEADTLSRKERDGLNEHGKYVNDNCWKASFRRLLAKYKQTHISLVRVFLLANAWNYGTGSGKDWSPPSGPNKTKWELGYAEHLRIVLDELERQKFRVVLSLLSHTAFKSNHRPQLARDASVRDAFFDNVFDPMLDVAAEAKYKNTVYAWEPVNEPNWATKYWQTNAGFTPFPPTVEIPQMQAFLDTATAHIRSRMPKVRVTHGFSYGLACEFGVPRALATPVPLPFVGVKSASDEGQLFDVTNAGSNYIRQLHYYPNAFRHALGHRVECRNDLPSCIRSVGAFLGEMSTTTPDWHRFSHGRPAQKEEHGDPQYLSWPRLNGLDDPGDYEATFYRLVLCNQLGYQKVYLWPNRLHNVGDPNSGLSLEALRGVKDFLTRPKLPKV